MKILMIVPTPFFSHRGCHVRIFEEAKFLKKRGHQVKLISYHLGETPVGFDIERIPNFFWYRKTETGASWHKIYLDFFLLLKTFFVARKFKPDVFHCHLHEGALIGLILKPIFNKKIIFDSQEILTKHLIESNFISPGSSVKKIILVVERFIYRHSPIIIVSNGSNYDILRDDFNIKAEKLFILPDGVDPKALAINEHFVDGLRRQYNLENKKIIVYLGTLNKIEGIDDLLELSKDLKNIRNDVLILIMGYPNVEYYRALAKELEVEGSVKFLGRINYDKIYDYLALGHFAISLKMPTSEGNGKLLNYAVSNLPIICYDHITNRYILDDNALYLDYKSSSVENAEKVDVFLNKSKEELGVLSEKSKNRILSQFSWENSGEELIKIYS